MTKPAAAVVKVSDTKYIVEGEREAKKLMKSLPRPVYKVMRLDLGLDTWEVGILERNYEA